MDNLAYKMQAMCISNRSRTSIHDKVRVCFYGRVSTQHEEQVNALSNQLQWYETILAEHPNWEKVNVYVDKGVTGTQAKNPDITLALWILTSKQILLFHFKIFSYL